MRLSFVGFSLAAIYASSAIAVRIEPTHHVEEFMQELGFSQTEAESETMFWKLMAEM